MCIRLLEDNIYTYELFHYESNLFYFKADTVLRVAAKLGRRVDTRVVNSFNKKGFRKFITDRAGNKFYIISIKK